MRSDANGDVYFVAFTNAYELRRINTEGQPSNDSADPAAGLSTSIETTRGSNHVHGRGRPGRAYVGYGATPGIIAPTIDAIQRIKPSGPSAPTCCREPQRLPRDGRHQPARVPDRVRVVLRGLTTAPSASRTHRRAACMSPHVELFQLSPRRARSVGNARRSVRSGAFVVKLIRCFLPSQQLRFERS
jgi:hypothetical protein